MSRNTGTFRACARAIKSEYRPCVAAAGLDPDKQRASTRSLASWASTRERQRVGLLRRNLGIWVEKSGLLRGRLGAYRQDDARRRLGRHDDWIECIVGSQQEFTMAADRSTEERDRARLSASLKSARATLLPLPPTTSRTPVPRTRSPGRQAGTVSVLSRQGFKVTQRIIGFVSGQWSVVSCWLRRWLRLGGFDGGVTLILLAGRRRATDCWRRTAPLSRCPHVGYGVGRRVQWFTRQGFPSAEAARRRNWEFSFHARFCHPAVALCPGVLQQPLHHDARAGLEPAGRGSRGCVADGLDKRDRDHPGGNLSGQRAGRPPGRPRRPAAGGRAALRAGLVLDACSRCG